VSGACELGKPASIIWGPLGTDLSSGWSRVRESTGGKVTGHLGFGVLIIRKVCW
jgi:hypothetical protein